MKEKQPRKKMSAGKIILIVIGAFVIISGLISKCESDEKENPNVEQAQPVDQIQQETPESKEWVEVLKFKGSGEKKSEIFELTGAKSRIKYNFKSSGMGMFAVYVLPEGYNLMEKGGFPEIMIDQAEEGESSLSHLKKGTYYMSVSSANGKWEISIEEFK